VIEAGAEKPFRRFVRHNTAKVKKGTCLSNATSFGGETVNPVGSVWILL